jgi:DNA-binding MarR family transcriptional regulator
MAETHPGLDLLEVYRDPEEGRRFLVRLTSKGKALLRQLQRG